MKTFHDFIKREYGLDFSEERMPVLRGAILKRIEAVKLKNFNEYLNLLNQSQAEQKNLIKLLTIGETFFFRNPAQFDALKNHVLPEIIGRPGNKTIRAWSAGCSSGEEAYSIAILLEGCEAEIYATDINEDYLKRAEKGVFSERSVSFMPEGYLQKYFKKEGSGYLLDSRIRSRVKFSSHNLIKDRYFEDIDFIFCRNVAIYFGLDSLKQIVEKFYGALRENGYLFLGHSETLWQISDQFDFLEFPGTFIYKKTRVRPKKYLSKPFFVVPAQKTAEFPAIPRPGKKAKLDLEAILKEAYLLANGGKYMDAILKLEVIKREDVLFLEAHYLLGILYAKIEKTEEAIKAFEKALYLEPELSIAYYNLGEIFLAQKKYSKARLAYQNAVKSLKNKPPEEAVDFSDNLTNELLLMVSGKRLKDAEAGSS